MPMLIVGPERPAIPYFVENNYMYMYFTMHMYMHVHTDKDSQAGPGFMSANIFWKLCTLPLIREIC